MTTSLVHSEPAPWRVALGFLLAPAIVPIVHAVLALVLPPRSNPPGYDMVDVLTWTTRSAYVLALPIGGAIIALLKTRGRLAAARVVCHSAAAGALVCATIACVPMLLSDDRECEPFSSIPEVFAVVAATAAALSAAVAGTFCLIAGIGRCSPAPTSRASP